MYVLLCMIILYNEALQAAGVRAHDRGSANNTLSIVACDVHATMTHD